MVGALGRNLGGASTNPAAARPGPDGAAGLVLTPASSLVLLHYAGRDAPAFANGQAVLLGPGPDITRALPASRGPPGPAGRCPPRPAGVLKVGRELLAERGGVLGIQVDLIVAALEGKPHGLLGRAAGQIIFQLDGDFWAISTFPTFNSACTVP